MAASAMPAEAEEAVRRVFGATRDGDSSPTSADTVRALSALESLACGSILAKQDNKNGNACCVGDGPCTTIWNAGALAYRCRTCQVNDSSAICPDCFNAGDHEGHDYSLYVSEHGGCCDCGDELSWRREGSCPRHGGPGAAGSAAMEVDDRQEGEGKDRRGSSAGASTAPGFAPEVETNLRCLFDLVIARLLQVVLSNAAACHRRGSSALSARLAFENKDLARELLVWVSAKTEDSQTSRALACDSFLRPPRGGGRVGANLALSGLGALACAGLRKVLDENGGLEEDALSLSREPDKQSILLLLTSLRFLPSSLVDALTTCILRLTYDDRFKRVFTECMVVGYGRVCDVEMLSAVNEESGGHLGGRSMHRNFLTRLTVQLFNCPNTTLELVERNGLLDVVLGFLDDLLWRCCKAGEEVVDVRSAHIAEKVYGRTLGDIQMILEHRTTVVSHVLGRRFDLLEKILSSFSRLQGMNPYVRRTGDHVERENTDWVNGVMLESDMFLNMFDQICHGMGPAVANGVGEVTRNIRLMGARAIAAATRWSEEGSGDPSLAYDRILAGEVVSVNLPLHRVCARVTQFFASAAALGASGLEGEALGQAKMQNLLSFVQENRESLARLVDPLLKAQAFMIQIRLGLWVRNGDEVVKLQRTYNSAMWFWHEISWELDNFLLKCWVSTQKPEEALRTIVSGLGGGFLLGMAAPDEPAMEPEEADGRIRLIEELLGELCKIFLDRTCVYDPRESVRRSLMHWLFATERETHSKLTQMLALSHRNFKGVDEILGEIATYHEPRLQEHGQYQLKPEFWAEFDPHFALYTRADLQSALENAENSKDFTADMPFRGVSTSQGDPLRFLFAALTTRTFHQMTWAALSCCLRRPSGYAEGAVKTALHLIFHCLDQTTRGGLGGGQTEDPDSSLTAAGFSTADLTTSLSHRPGGVQPSILDMVRHIAGEKLEAGECCSDLKFGASKSLRAAASHVLGLLRCAGVAPRPGHDEEAAAAAAGREEAEKQRKADRQAAVMAAFVAQQQAFLDTITDSDEEMEEGAAGGTVGVAQDEANGQAGPGYDLNCECALCKGEVKDTKSLCWVGHSQVSTFPLRGLGENKTWEAVVSRHKRLESEATGAGDLAAMAMVSCPPCPTSSAFDHGYGVIVKTCGHRLHYGCYMDYHTGLLESARAGMRYEGMGVLSVADGEFLCPVCRRISNVPIPCSETDVSGKVKRPNIGALSKLTTLCHGTFASFADKFDDRLANLRPNSSGPNSRNEGLKNEAKLRTNLIHLIGWNASHLEVLLRRPEWVVEVEAARCAARGQLLALRELVRGATQLAGTKSLIESPCVVRVRAVLAALKGNPLVPPTLWGADESEQEQEQEGQGLALPLVREFLEENAPKALLGPPRFGHLALAPFSTLDSENFDLVTRHAPEFGQRGHVASALDPFRLHVESEIFHPGASSEGSGVCLKLSVLQAAAVFVLDTYRSAVSEHLALLRREDIREAEEVSRDAIDAVFQQAEDALRAILAGSGHGGGGLRSRLGDFVAAAVRPYERRAALFRLCAGQGDLDFEDLARGSCLGASEPADILTLLDRESRDFGRVWCPNAIPQAAAICLLQRRVVEVPTVAQVFANLSFSLVRVPPPLSPRPRLIELPPLYQTALVEWLDRKCLRCGKVPKEPALCLVCGALCCCAESCCKDSQTRGECTQHTLVCGSRTGVFLLLRQTGILILSGSHACLYSSPYLDAHGEEDPSLKRGKPLFLDKNRYEALNLLWATGAFDYDSKVLKHSHGGTRRAYSAEFY